MGNKTKGQAGLLEADGPPSWRNWRAKRDGAQANTAVEVPLFSDAWFISEALSLGPYKLLNSLPGTTYNAPFEWKPAIVLRAEHLLPFKMNDMSVTDDRHYHGGTLYDEMAALISVLLGVRLVAGPIEREFGYSGDPLGKPRGHSAAVLPLLPPRTDAPQIEWLLSQRSLDDVGLLMTYPNHPPAAAFALVKSARLYQQALWISDTSPETAWLLLVSALENAANFWNAERLSPNEQLSLIYPSLAKALLASSDNTVLDLVAKELYRLIGATGKFLKFCVTFVPEPPVRRPQLGRFDFHPENYQAAMKKIYEYRSPALHGGTPFPHPMCMVPMSNPDGTGIAPECLLSLGVGARGATWVAGDIPMHLHLFAHISGGIILNWWRHLANASDALPS